MRLLNDVAFTERLSNRTTHNCTVYKNVNFLINKYKIMITELNDIKEVEIVAKADFKYYMLYIYNKNVKEPNNKYFLLNQSVNIDDLEHYKTTWELGEGDEFKVFAVKLPS